MKNSIILSVILFSFSSFASEKGVYTCTQVDSKAAKPVSIYVKVSHTANGSFSVTGLSINKRPEMVTVNFSEAIELQNDVVQFSQLATANQPSLEFSLKLNDSKSLLTLRYDDIQVENTWANCRLSQ